jgi:hypothetical protein
VSLAFAIEATADAFGDPDDAYEEATWTTAMHVECERARKRDDMRAARGYVGAREPEPSAQLYMVGWMRKPLGCRTTPASAVNPRGTSTIPNCGPSLSQLSMVYR